MSLRLLAILLLMSGCQFSGSYSVKAMPSPVIRSDVQSVEDLNAQRDIWYVTDRASTPVESNLLYSGDRSNRLHVGLASIAVTEATRNQTADKKRYEINNHTSLGYLATALPYNFLTGVDELAGDTPIDVEFSGELNALLKSSGNKDIYIYVHGYKTLFENPILLASQLWGYMAHQGAFISFAWPSTPRSLAYFKDIETAQISGHNLRLLLEYLSENTDAERINAIGYSSGTRVVLHALHELALKYGASSQ